MLGIRQVSLTLKGRPADRRRRVRFANPTLCRRDGGFPFSAWITKVKHGQPLHAMYLCIALSSILYFINFVSTVDEGVSNGSELTPRQGSAVALNAVLSVANAALVLIYMISVGCLTLKRLRGEPLLARSWDLGRAGLAMSLYSMGLLFLALAMSL